MGNIEKVNFIVKIACIGFVVLCGALVLFDAILNGSNIM